MTPPVRQGLIVLASLMIVGPTNAGEAIDAASLYAETCSVCHGDDGRGAVWGQASLATPPRNFRAESSRRELTRERMIASVTAGRPGTPMPGFATQLSATEISAVVDYIRSHFMLIRHAPDANGAGARGDPGYGPVGPVRTHPETPPELAGDAVRGEALYAANCADCHGLAGAGNGPRAYFIFPRPRNFHDESTRSYLTRRNLYNGIKFGVVGKEMPAWGKVWSDQEIADVTEYVYRQFIAPGADPDH